MATRARTRTLVLRPARDADVDEVAAIEREVFKDPWSWRSFADLVHQPRVLFTVAADEDALRGYAIVLIAGVESELANLATGRAWHRQGLGRRLLREAISGARQRGCREMYLDVRASNTSAIALYRSEGFEAVGRRARYYARPIEDAIVMKRGIEA